MPKRFIDSNLFKKNFIRGLKAPQKLLWIYLFCDCDNAGVWEIDCEIASIYTGIQIKAVDLKIFFGNRIILFDENKKLFIPDFIIFQYGTLNENNPAHKNVISELIKYQLIDKEIKEPLKAVGGTFEGTKDMDKVMVMDKDKEKDKEEEENLQDEFEFFWNLYDKKVGDKKKLIKKWSKLSKETKQKIFDHIPRYKEATPEKKFRKNFETYLNNESWNDEIIKPLTNEERKRNEIGQGVATIHELMEEARRQEAKGTDNGRNP